MTHDAKEEKVLALGRHRGQDRATREESERTMTTYSTAEVGRMLTMKTWSLGVTVLRT